MASDRITPEEANLREQQGERILYVDARNSTAWKKSDRKIPGAIRIPPDNVDAHLDELARDATVVAYCT